MTFTVRQALLLNNLMYLEPSEGPFPALEEYEGETIHTWADAIPLSQLKETGEPRMTTAEEMCNIVLALRKEERLLRMKILTAYTDLSLGGGACRSAVFIDADTAEAAVVFKGTELVVGSAQWKDNFISGNLTDTPHQIRALKWYRKVYSRYHLGQFEITLTGHSKGGNKAKYIAILDNTADHCISFDGEGFSDSFFSRYGMEIHARSGIIENHMVDYDYISPLLNDVGTATFYYGNNYGIGGFTENHLANTFMRFGEDGEFWIDVNEDGRPAEMLAFDEFANSYLRSLDDEQRTRGLIMLNDLLNAVLSVNADTGTAGMVRTFLHMAENAANARHIAYILAYLIRYEQKYPVVKNLLESVFVKFDLEGLVSYVNLVTGILNWKKQILWMSLDFDSIASAFRLINSRAPSWVARKLADMLEKNGINLTAEEASELADIIEMTDSFLKTITVHEDGTDRSVHPSVAEQDLE